MTDSPASSRSLCVSHWSERLQTSGLVGPGTNKQRRPDSGPGTGLTRVSKTHGWRDLACVLVKPTRSQRGRTAVSHQCRWRLHKCRLCLGGCCKGTFVLVLVSMAGWVYCIYSCVHLPLGNTCTALLLNGPINTELRLLHTNWAAAGGIPSGPEAPTNLATANSLVLQSPQLKTPANFLWGTHSSDYKTDLTQLVFRKVSDPAFACLIFFYCQFVPLGQILLQLILQDSGSKPKPKRVIFHGWQCRDGPLHICPCLSDTHISLVAAYDLHLSEWRRKRNSVPDSHAQASALWASNSYFRWSGLNIHIQ